MLEAMVLILLESVWEQFVSKEPGKLSLYSPCLLSPFDDGSHHDVMFSNTQMLK